MQQRLEIDSLSAKLQEEQASVQRLQRYIADLEDVAVKEVIQLEVKLTENQGETL